MRAFARAYADVERVTSNPKASLSDLPDGPMHQVVLGIEARLFRERKQARLGKKKA